AQAASGAGRTREGFWPLARFLRRGADRRAFVRLCGRLCRHHPDGTVTTALAPVEPLAQRWRGDLPFRVVLDVATRDDFRLLRLSRLATAGHEEQEHLSLGHDALAPVAAAWDEELDRQARF